MAEAAVGSTAGPGARIVPLHLADGALIDLVRVGDVVDVLAAPPTSAPDNSHAAPKVVATDAVVVLARQRSFMSDLFHRSVTARLLERCPVPVLVLPTATSKPRRTAAELAASANIA